MGKRRETQGALKPNVLLGTRKRKVNVVLNFTLGLGSLEKFPLSNTCI